MTLFVIDAYDRQGWEGVNTIMQTLFELTSGGSSKKLPLVKIQNVQNNYFTSWRLLRNFIIKRKSSFLTIINLAIKMSLSTKSSLTKLQTQKDDVGGQNSFDILRESNFLTPSPKQQEVPRRSIDVYNEVARNRMASLTDKEGTSLYALPQNINRSRGDQTNRKSSLSVRPSFSIEPRRRSEESFVSARGEEVEQQQIGRAHV